MNIKKVKDKLLELGYPDLFMYGERSQVDSIWQNGNNKMELENIITSVSSSYHAKFLAAEVLRYFEVDFDTKSHSVLAEVYVMALKNSSENAGNRYHLNGNLWGFIYELDDSGYLGEEIIQFGTLALPYLTELLNDGGLVLYEGSRDAMVGNNYQYRIKDFAAFYIAKIKNIPIKFYQNIEQRDKEIERLKGILKEE